MQCIEFSGHPVYVGNQLWIDKKKVTPEVIEGYYDDIENHQYKKKMMNSDMIIWMISISLQIIY